MGGHGEMMKSSPWPDTKKGCWAFNPRCKWIFVPLVTNFSDGEVVSWVKRLDIGDGEFFDWDFGTFSIFHFGKSRFSRWFCDGILP